MQINRLCGLNSKPFKYILKSFFISGSRRSKAAFKKKLNVTGVDFQKDQIESQNPDMLNFFKMI